MNSDRKLFENSFWFTSFLPFSKLPFLLSNCCDKLFFLFFCSCSFFRFRFRLISFCFLVFESSLKFFVCLFTYFAGLVLLLSSSSASSFYNFICLFFLCVYWPFWIDNLSICSFRFDLLLWLYKTNTSLTFSFHFNFVNMANFRYCFLLQVLSSFSLSLSLYVFWIGTFRVVFDFSLKKQLDWIFFDLKTKKNYHYY